MRRNAQPDPLAIRHSIPIVLAGPRAPVFASHRVLPNAYDTAPDDELIRRFQVSDDDVDSIFTAADLRTLRTSAASTTTKDRYGSIARVKKIKQAMDMCTGYGNMLLSYGHGNW